jgi:hypothetical protein
VKQFNLAGSIYKPFRMRLGNLSNFSSFLVEKKMQTIMKIWEINSISNADLISDL